MSSSQIEIAPGVFFKKDKDTQQLIIADKDKELIGWDYREVCESPEKWLDSLKAVAVAVSYGPSAVKSFVERKKRELDIPAGMVLCTVCNTKFLVGPTHPYSFIVKLNNKNYYEFHCSETCSSKRRKDVYKSEMGEEFMELWQQKFK